MKNNHSISNIALHLVLVTKFRKKFQFNEEILKNACTSAKCKLDKIGIADNHVHLLIEISPLRSVAKVVEIIKSVSSKNFARIAPESWSSWQVGYFVASVGRSSRSKVEKYLDNQ
jgi:putative transposase